MKEKFFYTTNISNMKGRIKMKKLLSLLLSLSMLTSMAVMPAKAEETVMPLNASRIDSEKLPSGNLIYLGTASANVKEEDAVYSFPIYRVLYFLHPLIRCGLFLFPIFFFSPLSYYPLCGS